MKTMEIEIYKYVHVLALKTDAVQIDFNWFSSEFEYFTGHDQIYSHMDKVYRLFLLCRRISPPPNIYTRSHEQRNLLFSSRACDMTLEDLICYIHFLNTKIRNAHMFLYYTLKISGTF
jgi:hypothetical protein